MHLPPYEHFPIVAGDRIALRQIGSSDIASLIEISYYDAVQATTLLEAAGMQDRINQDYADGNSIHWGIIDLLTDKIVGTCGYYRGLEKGEGELGCVLLPQYRGQGFMNAAMELAIRFGIDNIGLKRVFAITSKQNDKAVQLLERLNFIKIADLEEDEIEYEFRFDSK
jgi:ribosomal-protein-alanine N-acetyltransferase